MLRSVVAAGSGDRGAYLKGVVFEQGVIEVDLKGSKQRGGSFVGVVFAGVDGDTYESVYFRPFNFKAANPMNRRHAVQYIAHPDWPWDRLRRERTDEFEASVAPKPDGDPGGDQWFAARIEMTAKRVRVFIGSDKKPCLDVSRLGESRGAKVGLWFNGVASWANLRLTPAGASSRTTPKTP